MTFDPYDWRSMADRIEWALDNRAALFARQHAFYESVLAKRSWGRPARRPHRDHGPDRRTTVRVGRTMFRIRHIILAGLTSLCLGGAANAAGPSPIRRVVSFGDSLSDCGAFGFKPTTAPALTWNEQVAKHFHDDLKPNWVGTQSGVVATDGQASGPGGLCYAQGGARTAAGVRAGRRSPAPFSSTVSWPSMGGSATTSWSRSISAPTTC